jgi:hypothetical protein
MCQARNKSALAGHPGQYRLSVIDLYTDPGWHGPLSYDIDSSFELDMHVSSEDGNGLIKIQGSHESFNIPCLLNLIFKAKGPPSHLLNNNCAIVEAFQ